MYKVWLYPKKIPFASILHMKFELINLKSMLLLYKNQPIDLQGKFSDWALYEENIVINPFMLYVEKWAKNLAVGCLAIF